MHVAPKWRTKLQKIFDINKILTKKNVIFSNFAVVSLIFRYNTPYLTLNLAVLNTPTLKRLHFALFICIFAADFEIIVPLWLRKISDK